jgi:hypothetical protein
VGGRHRRIEVQDWTWANKHETLSEKQKQKRTGGIAQVIEYLPSKGTDLSSNPGKDKKKKTKRQNEILVWLCCTSVLLQLPTAQVEVE